MYLVNAHHEVGGLHGRIVFDFERLGLVAAVLPPEVVDVARPKKRDVLQEILASQLTGRKRDMQLMCSDFL